MSSLATGPTAVTSSPSAPTSMPPVVDVATLLAPIPGDNPAGENMQYSGLYDEIREARRSEDDLPQGDWQREPKVADWSKVKDLSTSALQSKSKDIQICSWMTESLVHLHGFVGLRDGLKVMRGLHDQFWDNFYPEIDQGDSESRANALSWFESKVAVPLKTLPLTRSAAGTDYNYLQWEESVKFEIPANVEELQGDSYNRILELKAQAETEGRTTGEAWRKAKDSTKRAFYEEQFLVVNECWEELSSLDRVMDERFGNQTPGVGSLKKALDDVRTLLEKLVKEKRVLEPDPVSGDSVSGNSTEEGGGNISVGPIHSREEALRRLAEVALYFQRTEPHSPVAYLVQRAIKWGQMPLEVWLEDVIRDGAVLGQIRETLGITTEMPGGNTGSE